MGIDTSLTIEEFAEKCLLYNIENNINIHDFEECPVHIYASLKTNGKACHKTNSTITTCCVCGKGMCPVCGNHKITQLSRITGYVQAVEGFNEGKKQELKDRKRYDLKDAKQNMK